MSILRTGRISSVFIETEPGRYTKITNKIDNAKLLRICGKAVRQEQLGTWDKFVHRHPNAMLIRSCETDQRSAELIMKWIQDYDFEKPKEEQYITTDLIHSEDFREVVKLYYSVGSLNIDRYHRGQNLRNDIMHYMKMAPLSANEFIMVHETCQFDQGLVDFMINGFLWARVKGGKFAYPVDQAEEIEQFCKDTGLWYEMMLREDSVRSKKWKADNNFQSPRDWAIKPSEGFERFKRMHSKTLSVDDGVPRGPRADHGRGRGGRGGNGGGIGRGRGGFRGVNGGHGGHGGNDRGGGNGGSGGNGHDGGDVADWSTGGGNGDGQNIFA